MQFTGITGKVAVVTGACGGMGQSIVEGLSDNGAHVVALDNNTEKLFAFVSELKQNGHHITAFTLDIRNYEKVAETIDMIEREVGPIEILIHAAGVLFLDSVVSLPKSNWDTTFEVNTSGVFHIVQAITRRMIPRQAGAIVVVSSNAARMPRMSMTAYAASKAATTMFVKCLGLELANYNIRCNIVSPGSTNTEMLKQLWKNDTGEQVSINGTAEEYRLGIPLRKIGEPVDVTNTILFLISDMAGHITMEDICVDGGATLGL
ncbi:2,3-dihydro-2,3-dihydroxybenzoate dehydrogenase [Virgibacillus salarius]|uniref:2,3-dihydro-2,3-dihydroxybenzoate dehydrogenase n=1 Tax=Virgibacillus salarius TaxID=447199 RepID=UPI000414268D|nr:MULTISPECIES: 2,3-dihydro-2,3-dihydroxybenzoate dehydrogenase [Bacillaceae]WBX78940.1 2,3-dihydro-2,3-dihydroxybenzoate dehydrogenase [Virgibacillus salarius]